jgi:hypothetical protein
VKVFQIVGVFEPAKKMDRRMKDGVVGPCILLRPVKALDLGAALAQDGGPPSSMLAMTPVSCRYPGPRRLDISSIYLIQ